MNQRPQELSWLDEKAADIGMKQLYPNAYVAYLDTWCVLGGVRFLRRKVIVADASLHRVASLLDGLPQAEKARIQISFQPA